MNPVKYLQQSNIYKNVMRKSAKLSQDAFDSVQNRTISNPKTLKKLDWLGKEISSAENRLILGVSALTTQPFIDMANRDVDEKTRKISVARTCAKIIAGTITGVIIRKGCIYAAKNYTKLGATKLVKGVEKPLSKLDKLLTPDNAKKGSELNGYVNSMGTLLALGVMTFTNFLIDAPATKYLTNKFSEFGAKKKTGGAK